MHSAPAILSAKIVVFFPFLAVFHAKNSTQMAIFGCWYFVNKNFHHSANRAAKRRNLLSSFNVSSPDKSCVCRAAIYSRASIL